MRDKRHTFGPPPARQARPVAWLALFMSGGLMIGAVSSRGQAADDDAVRVRTEFKYFVGTWRCDEDWSKTDFGPAHKSTAVLEATDGLDGVWLVWRYEQRASEQNRHPAKGADFWGYDAVAKKFVRAKIDNGVPGKVQQLTSTGWVGDTVAWEGQAPTPQGLAPFVHTFTKVDGKTILGKLFLSGQQFYSSTCKKT
jgi:hypothetical protein